jgi:hypothetical protein
VGTDFEFEVLERQGRVKIRRQQSSGTFVIYGDPRSLELIATAEWTEQRASAIRSGKEALPAVAGPEAARGFIDKEGPRKLRAYAWCSKKIDPIWQHFGASGKAVVVRIAKGVPTREERLDTASKLVHEMQHAHGANEYEARVAEADFRKKNGLVYPSREEILCRCLFRYLGKQKSPGEWRSWVGKWWEEKKSPKEKIAGVVSLAVFAVSARKFTKTQLLK